MFFRGSVESSCTRQFCVVPSWETAVSSAVLVVVVAAGTAAPQPLFTEVEIVERASGLPTSNDSTAQLGRQFKIQNQELRIQTFGALERAYNRSMTKLGILISGRGSNMMSIVGACSNGTVPAEVALVVSNKADAAGIAWAREQGLETAVLSHKDFTQREDHDRAIVSRLHEAEVEWVCLAGYMRLLSSPFIEAFPNRILNIHPSLLPSFPGLHGQRDALQWGVKVSGCTVHLVDLELDHGPIVEQRMVEVRDDDDEDVLAARILEQEHLAYPEALRKLLTQPWVLDGRRVVFGETE
jgi:phosphoribosylglycinamide formyltransferase-1